MLLFFAKLTMNDNAKPPNVYRFGPYQANTADLELRKSGIRIRLQPKPFQVLKVLLDRAGQSVSREELKGLLWSPDIFVDFDHGLNTAVNKIREALSDSAEEPQIHRNPSQIVINSSVRSANSLNGPSSQLRPSLHRLSLPRLLQSIRIQAVRLPGENAISCRLSDSPA